MLTPVAQCAYNGERFLAEQLEFIANQDLPINKIVICGGRSTNSTKELI